jgi:hypothetical protein
LNSENEIDNEEEGGEWVTPDNLYKHIGGGDSIPIVKTLEDDTV